MASRRSGSVVVVAAGSSSGGGAATPDADNSACCCGCGGAEEARSASFSATFSPFCTDASSAATCQSERQSGQRQVLYLWGELVDLGGDLGDGLGGLLEVAVPALLDEAARAGLGVLDDDDLGPILHAGHVQERLGILLLVLVEHLLVVRVQPRLGHPDPNSWCAEQACAEVKLSPLTPTPLPLSPAHFPLPKLGPSHRTSPGPLGRPQGPRTTQMVAPHCPPQFPLLISPKTQPQPPLAELRRASHGRQGQRARLELDPCPTDPMWLHFDSVWQPYDPPCGVT